MRTRTIPYLDGWRGLAIVLVLYSHFVWPGNGWAGGLGVTTFFVLSGLLMSELLFIKRVRLTDFFARRFSRVVPLFWLFVVAMTVYAATLQRPRYDVPMVELAVTLAFLRTYLPPGMDIWADQWAIGHLWSLNVEEPSYVYLALGVLACSVVRARSMATTLFLIVSTLLVVAITFWYAVSPPSGASPWYLRSESASLGLIAAGALHVYRKSVPTSRLEQVSPLLPLLSFLIAVACFKTYAHKDLHFVVGPLALAFTVVFLDRLHAFWRALLSIAVLRWFGRCSFSLYIWQQPFYLAMEQHRIGAPVAALATLICGTLSFYAFEDPSRRWLNGRWEARRLRLRGTAASMT
jgi:peptidoglycan/LPS O-acetylase OafA/YrhL